MKTKDPMPIKAYCKQDMLLIWVHLGELAVGSQFSFEMISGCQSTLQQGLSLLL